jgi:tetratricopeptide (TPR) repeat protein
MLLLGALPYLTTLRNGFIYDDFQQILENPFVHSFRHFSAVFGSTVWSFQGAEGGLNFYRPLITVIYLLCWSVSGPIPIVYHLLNITFQAANVALLYWVTRRLWNDSGIALAAGVLFAIHPIHIESVAWISGVTDLALTFFYLLAFGLYLETRRLGGTAHLRLAMLVSFAMALLSKEPAITLPAVVTVYEHFYSREAASAHEPVREKVWRYGPLWVLAGLYAIARALLVGGMPRSVVWHSMNLRQTILSGIASAGLYLGKLVWPVHLHLIYSFHRSESLIEMPVLAGFAGLGVCALLFRLLWRRARLATFGLIWLGLTVAPVLNLRWMPTAFAERYLYLPSIGFCWLLACGLVWLWRGPLCNSMAARFVLGCSLAIALIMCVVRIETRNREWSDQTTFVLHEIAASPNIGHLHDNLGSLYWQRGDAVAAEREWNTALRLNGEDEVAFAQIGMLRSQQKRYPEAFALLQQAIRIRPTFAAAHIGLGEAYAGAGRREDAEGEYRKAVKLAPSNVAARNLLGQALYYEGRWNEADNEFQASAAIEPSQQASDYLGDLASARGEADIAIRDYTQATALEPLDGHAHFRLGDLYAAAGRTSEATREYQDGLAANPNDPHALAALRKLQNSLP